MEFTEDLVKNIDKDFRDSFQSYLEGTTLPIKDIYVDLSMMVDYKLGTLLSIYRDNEEAFNYIIEEVKTNYNFLVGKNIAHKFPRIDIDDETIEKVLTEPSNSHIISALSPFTSMHDFILNFAEDIYQNNRRFNDKKSSTINLYLNNPYFELSEESKIFLTVLFHKSVVNITFIKDSDYTNPFIEKAEYLFINDLSLFNSSPLVIKMFEENSFIEKTLCATVTSDLDGGDLRNEETVGYFTQLENLLNNKIEFKLIHKIISL